jgi:hypothetical protein
MAGETLTSVTMKRTKETPGTFVFADESEDSHVPTLYIKKALFGDKPPKRIKLIIKTA